MMLLHELHDGAIEAFGLTAGVATTLTSGAADAKGSWTTVSSGLSRPAASIVLTVGRATWTNYERGLLDVAVGSGNEVIAANLLIGRPLRPCVLTLPISIPAGTGIKMRLQSSEASKELQVAGIAYSPSSWNAQPVGRLISYGINTTLTSGTEMWSKYYPTYGDWVSMGSVSTPLRGLFLTQCAKQGNNNQDTQYVDIGVGSAGSQVAVASGVLCKVKNETDTYEPNWTWLPVSIQSGTTLWVRGSCDYSSANLAYQAYRVTGYTALYGYT